MKSIVGCGNGTADLSIRPIPTVCTAAILGILFILQVSALASMPTERLPALGDDGNAYVVLKRTPSFPAISRRDSQYDMARYQLSTGEELAPTGTPHTFRTTDAKLVLTLIGN